jgi:hypothetical protein
MGLIIPGIRAMRVNLRFRQKNLCNLFNLRESAIQTIKALMKAIIKIIQTKSQLNSPNLNFSLKPD